MSGRELWADSRLRAAWAAQDWAVLLRRYRYLAGLSQERLGALIGLPQGAVSAIENGRRQITSSAVAARIVEGLQMPSELGGMTHQRATLSEWAPPAELRERIAHGQATGRTDLRTAEWIGDVLAQHRRAEDEVGGRELWPVVRAQLDAVTALIPSTGGAAADRLMLLAAEHAHWLSWVAWQEGRQGPALAWIDTAHGWAVDGGHVDMSSWVYRVRSWYSLRAGDPIRALRTAEAARALPGPLSSVAESAATHQACMAAAALGERDRARRLSDRALALALASEDEADRPGWLYWLTPTRARLQAADAAAACHRWDEAAVMFREVLPELDGYPRDRAHYEQRLAEAERRS